MTPNTSVCEHGNHRIPDPVREMKKRYNSLRRAGQKHYDAAQAIAKQCTDLMALIEKADPESDGMEVIFTGRYSL